MRTPSKTDKLNELRNQHDRVIVFTQNEEFVWDYLLNCTGRFTISYNSLLWDKKEHKKITLGRLTSGYKLGLVTGASGDVGLDCPGTDLVFTCNPFYPISKTDGVFKDSFAFPPLLSKIGTKPIDVLKHSPCAIRFSSANDLIKLHDFTTIHQIQHSIEAQSEEAIHFIKNSAKVNADKTVLIDGPYKPEELIIYQNCKEIWLNYEMEYRYPEFNVVREILRIFDEFPESGLSKDFIAFRMSVHPITLNKALEFLVLAGCLKKAYQNNDHITIHKTYIPNPDKLFQKIPEGTYPIKTLLKHFNIKRENLIPFLKHYEGKGLNFSYVPKVDEDLYVYVKPMKNEEYNNAYQAITFHLSFMNDWITNGDKFINRWLEQKIEKHCLETNSRAVLFAVGQATSLNFTSDQPDLFLPVSVALSSNINAKNTSNQKNNLGRNVRKTKTRNNTRAYNTQPKLFG